MNWNKLTVVFLAPLLIGCGTQKNVIDEQLDQVQQSDLILVEYEIVANGALYGGGEEQIEESTQVINSSEEWETLKAKMNSINNVTEGFKIKEIDFNSYTVIVCFDQVRPSGGFFLKVSTITKSLAQITVHVEKISPDMPATSVLTQPYEIVMIEKTNDLPVITQ